MRLIGIMYLVSFYDHFYVVPTNVTSELSTLMNRIINTNWKQQNHTVFNSDIILNTLEMIRRTGYPAEAHVVTTEDGYLLTLHRIPGGNDSLPVLLQHGLLSSSADWLVLGKGKALPYLLADQGYDVWLGNYRGNTYSRKHISLSLSDSTFWDFSFNEMGIYDLPAMITFITNMRSQSLHAYIGHSMGSTGFYVMASERPEIARMVQMMISLAPAIFEDQIQSPIRFLSPFRREFKMVMRYLFHDEFLQNDLLRFIIKYICDQNIAKEICVNVMFILFGYDYEQFDYALLPVILNHFPAGTSAKTIVHFAQKIQSGKFRRYDYDREKNLLIYNSVEPPEYDLASITVPIALFYADNDWLVSTLAIEKLSRILPNVIDIYDVPWPNFNHIDFLWAKDAPKLLYERILKIIREENSNNVTSTK